jgi:MFS transporter, putative metabolite:H+ symporter
MIAAIICCPPIALPLSWPPARFQATGFDPMEGVLGVIVASMSYYAHWNAAPDEVEQDAAAASPIADRTLLPWAEPKLICHCCRNFVPASKRGWVSGLSIGLLPLGPLLAALLSASLGAVIGWRGLFAIGLVPAAFVFVIRLWVPESPRWLFGQGRFEEARHSLAWALKVDPGEIQLPASLPDQARVPWLELFKYPRSSAAAILTGLSSTGAVGMVLWGATLLVLVLKVTPAEAAYLSVWIAVIGIPGRALGAWLSDALGRRWAGFLLSVAAGDGTMLAGYLHDAYIGAASAFFLLLLVVSFFSKPSFSVVFPYMAELWPAKLRASGFGRVYGCSNIAKFIGPAGLAVLAGASNYVAPKATLDALVPAFNYFAA